jgi:transcriptional regulator with XRE-family HTH domain
MVDDLARWLKEELGARAWSLREMARRVGVSHTAVANVASGRAQPSPGLCREIARVLQVPPEHVFRRAGLLPPEPLPTAPVVEANFLFAQLSEGEQKTLLTMMRALVEKRREISDQRGLASAGVQSPLVLPE